MEISKNMDAEGLKKLEEYAAELLHTYNDLWVGLYNRLYKTEVSKSFCQRIT